MRTFLALIIASLCGASYAEVCGTQDAAPDPCLCNWWGGDPDEGPRLVSTPDSLFLDDATGVSRCREDIPIARCGDNTGRSNCNDTFTCNDLLTVHDMLVRGGLNVFFRHGKTFWQQWPQETSDWGCHLTGTCIAWNGSAFDPNRRKQPQRNLQPYGYDELFAIADAVGSMDLPWEETFFTSPMDRCSEHGEIFASRFGPNIRVEPRWSLMYVEGFVELNNTQDSDSPNDPPIMYTRTDAFERQGRDLRRLLGTPPSEGRNGLFVGHGSNTQYGLGIRGDETYADIFVAAPENGLEDVECSASGGGTYSFPDGTYKLGFVSRMPPDAWAKMAQCVSTRDEKKTGAVTGTLLDADTDHNLEITREEFSLFCGLGDDDALLQERLFDLLDSEGVDQASNLGRTFADDGLLSIGTFVHKNWGWRDASFGPPVSSSSSPSDNLNTPATGGHQFPWRENITDTIPKNLSQVIRLYGAESLLVDAVCSKQPGESELLSSFEDPTPLSREELFHLLSRCEEDEFSSAQADYILAVIDSRSCPESWAGDLPSGIPFGPPAGRTRSTAYDPGAVEMVELQFPVDESLSPTESYTFRRARLGLHLLCDERAAFDIEDLLLSFCSGDVATYRELGAGVGSSKLRDSLAKKEARIRALELEIRHLRKLQ